MKNKPYNRFTLLWLWLLFLPLPGFSADIIVHPVQMLDRDKRARVDASELNFSAMGKDFRISLTPSNVLNTAAMPAADLPQLMQGRVDGFDQSWARISISNGEPTGYIWLEDQLYKLALSDQLPTAVLKRSRPTSKWVLYQPNDIPSTRMNNTGIQKVVTRTIRIGVAIDSQFDMWHQGRGLAKALEIINGVDGLYQEQLGVAIVIETITELYKLDTDPLLSIDGKLEDVLLGFRDYRATQPSLNTALTLVHLFSGHRDAMSVVGLGWIDTACRADGYDLSVSTPFAFDVLLAAHEIAHNLGALHDDDPRCGNINSRNNTLMISTLNSETTSTLSNCSLNNMQAAIDRSCNLDNLDLALRVRSAPSSSNILQRRIVLTVENTDTQRTAGQTQTQTTFPEGTVLSSVPRDCSLANGALVCSHNNVAPLSLNSLSLVASLPDVTNQRISSTLEVTGFSDVNQLNNRSSIDALTNSSSEEIAQADATQTGGSGGGSGRTDYILLLIMLLGLQLRLAIGSRRSV